MSLKRFKQNRSLVPHEPALTVIPLRVAREPSQRVAIDLKNVKEYKQNTNQKIKVTHHVQRV